MKEKDSNVRYEFNDVTMYDEMVEAFRGREYAVALSYMGKQITAKRLCEEVNLWADRLI